MRGRGRGTLTRMLLQVCFALPFGGVIETVVISIRHDKIGARTHTLCIVLSGKTSLVINVFFIKRKLHITTGVRASALDSSNKIKDGNIARIGGTHISRRRHGEDRKK